MDLPVLRQHIDDVDRQIVDLLNKRAQIAMKIGAVKKDMDKDASIYHPAREQQIYEKLSVLNTGPMATEHLISIYREIMSASINLQKDTTIACPGPEGTFSSTAAKQRFGESVSYLYLDGIPEVIKAVSQKQVSYGLIPFENSYRGSVTETLDSLGECDIQVIGETSIRVQHSIMSISPLHSIHKVYSHPEALRQCSKWLDTHLPNAQRLPTSSTAFGADMALKDHTAAAIGHERLVQEPLQLIENHIEDYTEAFPNATRFLIIQPASTIVPLEVPGKISRSLCRFTVDHHQPGALAQALDFFKQNQLNITKLDTRPTTRAPWHYWFFIECEGNVLQASTPTFDLTCLGVFVKEQ